MVKGTFYFLILIAFLSNKKFENNCDKANHLTIYFECLSTVTNTDWKHSFFYNRYLRRTKIKKKQIHCIPFVLILLSYWLKGTNNIYKNMVQLIDIYKERQQQQKQTQKYIWLNTLEHIGGCDKDWKWKQIIKLKLNENSQNSQQLIQNSIVYIDKAVSSDSWSLTDNREPVYITGQNPFY